MNRKKLFWFIIFVFLIFVAVILITAARPIKQTAQPTARPMACRFEL